MNSEVQFDLDLVGKVKFNISLGTMRFKTGNISLDFVLWAKVKFDVNIGFFTYGFLLFINAY